MSHPTLPGDRPRWAVRAVRVAQAALAVLALAVLALSAAARPVHDRDRARAGAVVLVPGTTLAPPGYTPVPAGQPCPAAKLQGVSR